MIHRYKIIISSFAVIIILLIFTAFDRSNSSINKAKQISLNKSYSPSGSMSAGKEIYDDYCATCHGINGKGDGPSADEMKTKPTDFTSGMYEFKSTPYGTLPTKEDIVSTLKLGVRTTAMIPQLQLTEKQMYEVAGYVLSFAPKGQITGEPINIPQKPGLTASLINSGKKLFDVNCVSCHGKDLKGDGPNSKKLVNYKGKPIQPADLTVIPLKRGNSPEWIYKIISNGIEGTPMISYYGIIKPEEIWDVVYYINSIPKENLVRRNNGGMMGGMNGMMGGMMRHGLVGEESIGMKIDMAAARAWMMRGGMNR
ncbi:MAG: c-type cytochrome [Ignavibacteriaceae bacterium]